MRANEFTPLEGEMERKNRLLARRRIRAGIGTRHVYGYEKKYLSTIEALAKQRSLSELLPIANTVWEEHYHGQRRIPEIRFGPGTKELGYPLSYTLGYSLIELAPGQRDILTLIHELVHAIGPSLHGINFTRVYYNILKNYLPSDEVRDEVRNVLITKHEKLLSPYYKKLKQASQMSEGNI